MKLAVYSLLAFSPTVVLAKCGANSSINIGRKSTRYWNCQNEGRVRLLWETTGSFGDDEYFINVKQNGSRIYRSGQHGSNKGFTKSNIIGTALAKNYRVEFQCDLEGLRKKCEGGNFNFALIDCGTCPWNRPRKYKDCDDSSIASAENMVCFEPWCPEGQYADGGQCQQCLAGTHKRRAGPHSCMPCPAGTFSADFGAAECLKCPPGEVQDRIGQSQCTLCPPGTFANAARTQCEPCPHQKITETSLIDYTGANVNGCRTYTSAGYWALAEQGSVSTSGTHVLWQLTKGESTSRGVEHTYEYSQEFSVAMGSSTYFETSVSTGFTVGVQSDIVPLSAESSIEIGSTTGEEKSFEVTNSASTSISRAVSSVITNEESTTCTQTCHYNPEDPQTVNGFIYNWVEVLFDSELREPSHFVRTCRTVCKYDSIPPLCPPGYCANIDCDKCLPGAFSNSTVDAAASEGVNQPLVDAVVALQDEEYLPFCHTREWRLFSAYTRQSWVWDLSKVRFYRNSFCEGEHIQPVGESFASGSHPSPAYAPGNAFESGLWGGRADSNGNFYIGFNFDEPAAVKCISIDQPKASNIAYALTVQAKCHGDDIWYDLTTAEDLSSGTNIFVV